MEKSSRENLVNDIENRLDDFFDESQEAQAPPSPTQTVSLEKLKSVVLSIDWEITETCLTDLISETDSLLPALEDDRYSFTLLRMLKAVGGYIRKRKAQAHPDAIKRIMSVFASIEQLIGNANMEEPLRKQIVAKEITAFKKLKDQIELQTGKAANNVATQAGSTQQYVDRAKFEAEMSAVEKRLNTQVESLKAQLVSLQKELNQLRSR